MNGQYSILCREEANFQYAEKPSRLSVMNQAPRSCGALNYLPSKSIAPLNRYKPLYALVLQHHGKLSTDPTGWTLRLCSLKLQTAIAPRVPATQAAIGLKEERSVGTYSNTAVIARKSGSESDSDLITRAKNGDQEAFAALFDAHKRRVYSLCLQMTGDVADAEDLTQDAFIQVFRKLATFRGDSAFSTWLYRVAVNTVLMKLRRRRPRQVSFDEPVCLDSSFVPREYGRNDPHLQGTVDRLALVRAIKELPDGYRTIFILHDIEGHDHREIARLLHCSMGNSKSQLHKARLRIRELLRNAQSGSPAKNVTRPRISRVALGAVASSRTSWPARSTSAPKGYEEVLLNSWESMGMWGEVLHGQRG